MRKPYLNTPPINEKYIDSDYESPQYWEEFQPDLETILADRELANEVNDRR